jgi:sec-independent protein translocase protein TatA
MGFFEVLVIVLVLVFFFGASKLPALGTGLGKAVRSFKAAVSPEDPPKPEGKGDGSADGPPRS